MTFRKPKRGPSPFDVADRDRWERLVDASLSATRKSAETWRAGLAAFVTLVTGALFFKGPEAAAEITDRWLIVLTVATALGLASAVRGLWLSLEAAAGAPADVSYSKVRSEYGGVQQFEIASARAAAAKLNSAKAWVAWSLALLGISTVLWWWAPPEMEASPNQVTVVVDSGSMCGTLESADKGLLRVQVSGESTPRRISISDMENLIIGQCEDG